jgi:dynein heavy chain
LYLEKQIQWNEKLLEMIQQYGEEFDEYTFMQQDREDELALVLPKFQDAIQSLETLTPADMSVLRKYEHPPQLVLETMEDVMVLRGEYDCSWNECKVMLSDTYFFGFFINRAKNYDKDNVSDEVMQRLERSMLNPDFEPAVVAQASVPCGALCKWVRAVYEYARTKRIVQEHPEELTEESLTEDIDRLREELTLNKDEVASAEQKLLGLQQEFEQRKKDLKSRYDKIMDPLQETFFEAHHQYRAEATSPRRK